MVLSITQRQTLLQVPHKYPGKVGAGEKPHQPFNINNPPSGPRFRGSSLETMRQVAARIADIEPDRYALQALFEGIRDYHERLRRFFTEVRPVSPDGAGQSSPLAPGLPADLQAVDEQFLKTQVERARVVKGVFQAFSSLSTEPAVLAAIRKKESYSGTPANRLPEATHYPTFKAVAEQLYQLVNEVDPYPDKDTPDAEKNPPSIPYKSPQWFENRGLTKAAMVYQAILDQVLDEKLLYQPGPQGGALLLPILEGNQIQTVLEAIPQYEAVRKSSVLRGVVGLISRNAQAKSLHRNLNYAPEDGKETIQKLHRLLQSLTSVIVAVKPDLLDEVR